jgi:hypothetical protein
MEELLFDVMRSKGFGDQYVRRYRMVTAFHLQRRPLIVFICGSACTGELCSNMPRQPHQLRRGLRQS